MIIFYTFAAEKKIQESWIKYDDVYFQTNLTPQIQYDNGFTFYPNITPQIHYINLEIKQPQLLKNLQYKETETEFLLKFEPFGILIDGRTMQQTLIPHPESIFIVLHFPKDQTINPYLEYVNNKGEISGKSQLQIAYNQFNIGYFLPFDELFFINFNENNKELLLDLNKQKKNLLIDNSVNSVNQPLISSLESLKDLENLTFCGCTHVDSCIRFFFKTKMISNIKNLDTNLYTTLDLFGDIYYIQLGHYKLIENENKEYSECSFHESNGIKYHNDGILKMFLIIDNDQTSAIDQVFCKSDNHYLYIQLFSNNKKFNIKIDKKKKEKTICESDNQKYEVSISPSNNGLHIKLFTNQESKIQKSDYDHVLDYREGKKDNLIYYDDGKRVVIIHEITRTEKNFTSILGWSVLFWLLAIVILYFLTNQNLPESLIYFIVPSLLISLIIFLRVNIFIPITINTLLFAVILIIYRNK